VEKEHLAKFHTLDVEYNGEGPFTAASNIRGGLSLNLSSAYDGFIYLNVRFEVDKNTTKHFAVKTVKPGDSIKITYDGPATDNGSTIDKIEGLELNERPEESPERQRLGFDVTLKNHKKWRLSHPENGGIRLALANVPLDHSRVWVSAGNDEEEWYWQLEDLYAGDSITLEIVATDWCDPFPNVTKKTGG